MRPLKCDNPNLILYYYNSELKDYTYQFLGSAYRIAGEKKKWQKVLKANKNSFIFPVRCGSCHSCRKYNAYQWIVRNRLEARFTPFIVFVTLTYNPLYLPDDERLCTRDVQLFFKRLRKRLSRKDIHIRYFGCGEYGEKKHRPHYHFIIYIDDIMDLSVIADFIDKSWQLGFTSTNQIKPSLTGLSDGADVDVKAIAYVARYTIGKQYSDDRYKPILYVSRRPAIGYFEEYARNYLVNERVVLDGHAVPVPEIYWRNAEKLGLENLKKSRQEEFINNAISHKQELFKMSLDLNEYESLLYENMEKLAHYFDNRSLDTMEV